MRPDDVPDDLPELFPIILSERDWEILVATLDNPPPVPDNFKAAIVDQKEKLRQSKTGSP